ncbi:MAE_28990/MAE_18760 family HEPN-like nuclease [Acetobacter pasteurianus]|uniref:RiboL-PSP-HEPN domain-containing protein n=1 Tax=Acetobacter pasteurianus NBRC 3188 TaxID=1226663 RepID=A0A401WQ06_ACEPA|nr:MAE_28990/MAE_18760 family HEPN-like nuclease [Acetobacter pasteurianus]GCD51403.1 hypothetical protein NBRC3188_0100 [Acetobacter pasteurianus NBRC 3188]
MMEIIRSDMEERETSLHILMDHIIKLTSQKKTINIIVILKASLYVALYNNVEATVYAVLEKVHCELSNIGFNDLSPALKSLMISYGIGKNNMQDKAKAKRIVKERFENENTKFPQLSEFLKRKSIFSGNLDARKLRVICKLYGMDDINFSQKTDRILIVKNKRNKISHGELSLLDAGKGISNNEMKNTIKDIHNTMTDFVSHCKKFLEIKIH